MKKEKLYFLPLGGAGEIGMNLNLISYDDQWLMIDLGLTFHDRLGIELVLPNPQFIIERRDHLLGLVITHGHEDHIGAIPYLWEKFKCPIYATPFTAELIKHKLKDHQIDYENYLKIIPLQSSVQVGPFDINMVTLTHSIPEPNGLFIRTPVGNIFHTGDWKYDPSPLIGDPLNENILTKIGDEGVLAMISDSTNVFQTGKSGSENDVRNTLTELVGTVKEGALFVSCFASNVARLESIAMAAEKHGRQVAIVGRGFHKISEISKKLGYLKTISSFIDLDKALKLPRNKVLYVCSGSQGEARAALNRVASEAHPQLKMHAGDTVIFSSRVIPGNEKSINSVKNKIIRLGVKVIFEGSHKGIHVSGHPGRDDLIQLFGWIRPHVLIPVHGEALHMVEQGKLARKHGVPHVIIPQDGSLIELSKESSQIIDEVSAGRLVMDGNILLSFNHASLKERARLGCDGIAIIVLTFDENNALAQDALISFHGLNVEGDIKKSSQQNIMNKIESFTVPMRNNDGLIEDKVRHSVQSYIQKLLNKKPLVVTKIIRF